MKYQVVDTFGGHVIGEYETRGDALYAIRLYCVQKIMSKAGLVDQNFINLIEDGDEVIYTNPIGFFPTKPKFKLNKI